MPTSHAKAFTLIELLVVVSIISVLSSIVMGVVVSAKKSAQTTATMEALGQLKLAMSAYQLSHGFYPSPGTASLQDFPGGTHLLATLAAEGFIPSTTYMKDYAVLRYTHVCDSAHPCAPADETAFNDGLMISDFQYCAVTNPTAKAVIFFSTNATVSYPGWIFPKQYALCLNGTL